jgi:hypothetical protein
MSYKVVYNSVFGGFGMSKEGLAKYNRLTSKDVKHAQAISPDDPILIHLVETMGDAMDTEYSRLKIKEFPIKYKSFLKWTEYDGRETVRIDYERYLISTVQSVIDDLSTSSDEKIARIRELYQEYDSMPKMYF